MTRKLTALVILIALAQLVLADEKPQLSKEEQEVVDLTNKERKEADLPPLKVNEKLVQAAREHSANMAKQDKLSHTLDDKGPAERLSAIGYIFSSWAENVAEGQKTPAEVVETWMKSEMHKANILSKNGEIGVGVAKSADGKKYWTQVFGNPTK